MTLNPGFFSVLFHSEDYYGDLDLKTIRKSELLAGTHSSGESRNVPKPQSKPRPTPVASRPTPTQE